MLLFSIANMPGRWSELLGPGVFVDIVREYKHTHANDAGEHQKYVAQDGSPRGPIHSHCKVVCQVAKTTKVYSGTKL